MADYSRPESASPLVRKALGAGSRARSIRIIEHAIWEAQREGVGLLDDPDVISALEWLGFLYLIEDKPAKAVAPLRDALKARQRQLGADHPHSKYLLVRLTDAYEAQGKEVKAIPRLEQRLAADLQRGPADRRAVRSRSKLFAAYWSAGRIQDAFELYRDALATCERLYGPDAQETIDARYHLAWTYLNELFPDGVPLLERNIVALERIGCRPQMLAFQRSELAMVYIWFGRASDAVKTAQRGLEDVAGRDDREARIARDQLLRYYAEAADMQAQ